MWHLDWESHELESLPPLARNRLVHPANDAVRGVPGLVTIASSRQNEKIKIKSSKRQTPTSTIIKCCLLTRFSVWACVKMSGFPPSGPTRTHIHSHIHTHVSIHRSAQLCWTPPSTFRSILLRSFCSLSVVLLFSQLGEKRRRGRRRWRRRDRWRGGVRRRKETGGPQLLRAIVSITCSSLLLSLCLLACSSRSSADKIWGHKGREVSWCSRLPGGVLTPWKHSPQTRTSEDKITKYHRLVLGQCTDETLPESLRDRRCKCDETLAVCESWLRLHHKDKPHRQRHDGRREKVQHLEQLATSPPENDDVTFRMKRT